MTTAAEKMKRKEYQAHLHSLQVELCALRDWVKQEGLRVVVVFEGRDAAGKGGTIKAIAGPGASRRSRISPTSACQVVAGRFRR
jgi:polyphosphate kinase 2 (PPK2 family)